MSVICRQLTLKRMRNGTAHWDPEVGDPEDENTGVHSMDKFFIVSAWKQTVPLPSVGVVKVYTRDGNITGYKKIEDAVDMVKKLREQYPYHKFEIVTYTYLIVYD